MEGEPLDSIHIYGGNFLRGETKIQGSKNAALPILAATLLIEGISVIQNCPQIADVYHMQKLLEELGCHVSLSGSTVTVDASHIQNHQITGEAATRMRSSIMLLGALLGRMKEASMAYPGGCVIGKRPIDLHLAALRQMGVAITEQEQMFTARTDSLRGMDYRLPFPSVGATENILLTAVLAEGSTRLTNAAREPEIEALCGFLKAAGAKIKGEGSDRLVIRGVKQLHEVSYRIPEDRIVAGTYLMAALAAGGDIFLEKAPASQMEAVLDVARRMGSRIQVKPEGIRVCAVKGLQACPYLKTDIYDGFPTDLQSPMMVALAVAGGESRIEEKIFEDRFRIVEELKKMGADIHTVGSSARIRGVSSLKGAEVSAQELRGGAALVVAGLAAKGETLIRNRHFIERGYEDICRDLKHLGAEIHNE